MCVELLIILLGLDHVFRLKQERERDSASFWQLSYLLIIFTEREHKIQCAQACVWTIVACKSYSLKRCVSILFSWRKFKIFYCRVLQESMCGYTHSKSTLTRIRKDVSLSVEHDSVQSCKKLKWNTFNMHVVYEHIAETSMFSIDIN